MAQIRNKDRQIVPIRALLDPGSTSTIIVQKLVQKLGTYKKAIINWKIMGGIFQMQRNVLVKFQLPEFSVGTDKHTAIYHE